MSAIDYSGKKIVVTGGFSGIGAALVSLLQDNGATDITVLDIKQADGSRDKFIETNLGDPRPPWMPPRQPSAVGLIYYSTTLASLALIRRCR